MTVYQRIISDEWRAPINMARRLGIFRRGEMIAIGMITVASVVFETLGVGMLLPIVQFVENHGNIAKLTQDYKFWRVISDSFAAVGVEVSLIALSAIVLLLLVLRQVTSAARLLVVARARAQASKRLSDQCFAKIMSCRSEYLQRFGSGNFSYFVSTLAQSSASIIRVITGLLGNCVTIAGYGVIMVSIAFIPTLIAVAFGILSLASISTFVRMARRTSEDFVNSKARFSQFLVERMSAWRLVKVSNSFDLENRLTRRYTTKLAAIDVRLAKISIVMNFIVIIGQSFLALFILNVSVGILSIEISVITLLFVAMIRLMPVIANFSNLRQTNATIHAYLSRLTAYLEAGEANREIDSGTRKFTRLREAIEFDRVAFTYAESDHAALRDLTVSIRANRITAITGPSGAGKSTMVDMLPRLIVPQSGAVRFDGVSVSEFSLRELRAGLHYVGQTPLLMNGSVAENVGYARQDATQEEIVQACKQAHAHDFIVTMAQGYDTQVGEGGALLSGGQRQRLALARVFLSDATIIVLDEPTSALDYESENKIHAALKNLVAERQATIIIIAHRASTVQSADFVVVLDTGRLAASGSVRQLSRKKNWLQEIVQRDGDEQASRNPDSIGSNGEKLSSR